MNDRSTTVRDAEDRELAEIFPEGPENCRVCHLPLGVQWWITPKIPEDTRPIHLACYWRERAEAAEAELVRDRAADDDFLARLGEVLNRRKVDVQLDGLPDRRSS